MGANFNPTRGNFTELKPFRYWCMKILPLTYDDSLSYYELLCKVVDALNKSMEDIETLNGDVTAMYTAFDELQGYVNNYFDNLDISEEVNARLDEMVESGEFDRIVEECVGTLIEDIQNEAEAILDNVTESSEQAISEIDARADTAISNVENVANTEINNVRESAQNSINSVTRHANETIKRVEQSIVIDTGEVATGWLEANISPATSGAIDKTLTVESAMADAKSTGERTIGVSNNKENVKLTGNLVRPSVVVAGYYDPQENGKEKDNITGQNYKRDQTYYVINDEQKFIASFTAFVVFYNSQYQVVDSFAATPEVAYNIPATSKYIRWSGNLNSAQLAVSRLFLREYLSPDYDYTYRLNGVEDDYTTYRKIFHVKKIEGNVYDVALLETGYYDLDDGSLQPSDTWKHNKLYYPIYNGQKIISNFRPFIHYYDANKNMISAEQILALDATTPPSGAKFFRYSCTLETATEPVRNITICNGPTHLLETPEIYNIGKIVDNYPVIIAKDGSGSGTHLLSGLYKFNRDIIVKAGTYDLVEEYKTRFGSNIFSTISDNTDYKGFQYGYYIDNRTVRFLPGAKVVCDISNENITIDADHRFCPINLGSNAKLIDLDVEARGTFYVVHDDFGWHDKEYTNEMINCVFGGSLIYNTNVVGGGCRPYSKNVIDGCFMINRSADNTDVIRYHNYNSAIAQPTVLVKDTKVNGNIKFNYYGTQSNVFMKAIAYNNTGTVLKGQESLSYDVDNVRLLAWNNN